MSERTLLSRYVRHAEMYGVGGIFECARTDLEAIELGMLALQLRRVALQKKDDWSLGHAERDELVTDLLAAGVEDRRICAMAGISRQTLWRMRRRVVQAAEHPPDPALQSGGLVSDRPPLGIGSGLAA
jgi:hypothetical protein